MKNILKHMFALILPVTVLVLVPFFVEKRWNNAPGIFLFTGLLLIVGGGLLLIGTISMFIRIGKGTLAPWSPTTKLVRSGVYAYTRNPMITGVLTILLGESIMLRSTAIFTWFLTFFIINNIYFVLFEEPGLIKRFGEEYREYRKNVPRWIPRLTPWKPH